VSPGLIARGITRRVGEADASRIVLDAIDCTVGAGEFVAITGASGIGKSTFLNVIAGLELPDAGMLQFDGVDLLAMDDDTRTRWRRATVGFIFQAFHLLPWLTAFENVMVPMRLLGRRDAAARGQAMAMLEAVGVGERAADPAGRLSGGEAQRVAIARALVHGPALVLADEPTGNLDPDSGARILALLAALARGQGAAVLLVTHSREAASVADRVLLMTRDGLAPSTA